MFKPWMIWSLALGGLLVIGTGCEDDPKPKPTPTPTPPATATGSTSPAATNGSEEEESTSTTEPSTTEEPNGTEATPEGTGKEPAGTGEEGEKPDAGGTEGEGTEGAEGAGATIGGGGGATDGQAQVDQVKQYITEKKWAEAEAALSKLEQRQDQLPTRVQKQVVNARKAVDKGKSAGAAAPGTETPDEEPDLTK